MTKREKILEDLHEQFGHALIDMHNASAVDADQVAYSWGKALAKCVVEAIEELPKKKRAKGDTPGAKVFESYAEAWSMKYKQPRANVLRNATINNQCSQLAARLGEENAIEIARFYVSQNDRFYSLKMHPIGLCLKDAETLWARYSTGKTVSRSMAQRSEQIGASLQASQNYLRRKHENRR